MLHKFYAKPNQKIEVIKDLIATERAGSYLSGHITLPPGTQLIIVEGPKKRDGINTAIINYNGAHMHAYWSDLRLNTKTV